MIEDMAKGELRRGAEASLAAERCADTMRGDAVDAMKILHELQIHQVELELQNAELRRTRDDLDAALARYADFYDLSPVALITLKGDGGIREMNFASRRMLGAGRSAFNGRLDTFISASERPDFNACLARVLGEQGTGTIDVQLEPVNGCSRQLRMELTAMEKGRSCRVVAMDVTELKQAEQELRQVNRTQHAYSNSVQALVHASEETDYLHEVCRIVVEDCGHAMVWIGFAVQDARQSITPVAFAGTEEGYLDTLNLTWADRERGRGPTGTAIRNGESVICHNIHTDPDFLPWRDDALRRGYASAIALPMIFDGTTLGALTIYSRQPTRFSEREVRLLQKLAEDLAYGLSVLRLRTERAEKEAKLEASEARFRLLAAATFEGIVFTDQGRIVDANDQLLNLLGYTRRELIGKQVADLMPDDDRRAQVIRNIERGVESRVEHELIRKDGRRILVEAHGQSFDGERRKTRVTALREITERQKAQEALHASETRYRLLVEQTVDGIFLADSQGHYLDVNLAGEQMLGYSRDEILTMSLPDLLVPDEVPRLPDAVARFAGGNVVTSEWRFRRKDGSIFLGEVRGRQLPNGHLQGVLRDVSERKVMEDNLRLSEQSHRILFDLAPMGMGTAGPNGRFSKINEKMCLITGYTADELLAMKLSDVMHPDDVARCGAQMANFLSGRIPAFEIETRFIRKDGNNRWVTVTARMVTDTSQRPLHSIAMVQDITDRKTAELALIEADRRKDAFLATLAHELRNPLAPVRNALAVLKRPDSTSAGRAAVQDMIERQVRHMVRLIDDLLDVSRITHGRLELRLERIELATVLQHAVEASRPHVEHGRHTLNLSLPPKSLCLRADPVRLTQVFTNLINNACKYSEPGGSIHIRAECDGDDVVVKIMDSGIGIAPEQLPRLFEMFTQVETHSERAQRGLGIGLSLAHRLVAMHGGDIVARSEGRGRGSEFCVRLPATSDPAPRLERGPAKSVGPAPQPKRRILVVDDNQDSADSLAMLLGASGFSVETAHDGFAAVDAAARFRPHIVLLDIGLPKQDGYAACRQIREQTWGADMAILAMTGWGQEEDRIKSREAGFNEHLVKPIAPDALLQLLAELAGGATPINEGP
ncbi:MAG: PAS domain S-box protein [Thiobacillaceae bacterium]